MPSPLTAAAFEAIVNTGIDEATLEAAIDRETADLESLIGALDGDVSVTLRPPYAHVGPLALPRFASEVEVEVDGAVATVVLMPDGEGRAGGYIDRVPSSTWGTAVDITITPADEAAVIAYLIEATRRAVVPDHERVVGEDRATAALHRANAMHELERLLARLRPSPRDWTTRIRSAETFLTP